MDYPQTRRPCADKQRARGLWRDTNIRGLMGLFFPPFRALSLCVWCFFRRPKKN